ncbi:hypothetical protein ACNJYD_37390 [Bradyrhizobium sp. DASA03005]
MSGSEEEEGLSGKYVADSKALASISRPAGGAAGMQSHGRNLLTLTAC